MTSLQSKHQQQQLFEVELNTNGKRRIDVIIATGRQLIESEQCDESEAAVKVMIRDDVGDVMTLRVQCRRGLKS